jgi:hypothetical protein
MHDETAITVAEASTRESVSLLPLTRHASLLGPRLYVGIRDGSIIEQFRRILRSAGELATRRISPAADTFVPGATIMHQDGRIPNYDIEIVRPRDPDIIDSLPPARGFGPNNLDSRGTRVSQSIISPEVPSAYITLSFDVEGVSGRSGDFPGRSY